ncbi:MAG: ATP-binding protein [Fusobacteriaceae bacterium]
MNQPLGIIKKVFINKIIVEIYNLNSLNQNYEGDIYVCGGIDNYISIDIGAAIKVIYQIVGIYEEEKPILKDTNSKFLNIAYFEAIPIGTLEKNKFEFGITSYPMISDNVFMISNKEFDIILEIEKLNKFSIKIGELSNREGYSPELKIDNFLTTHCSILGNTGSGKSTTIKRILLEIEKKIETKLLDVKKINFYIFDVHGEYKELLKEEYCNYTNVQEMAIPLEELELLDWINLIIPSLGVQLPVIINALRLGELLENKADSGEITFRKKILVFCALTLYKSQQIDAGTKRQKIMGLLGEVNDLDINAQLKNYSSQYANFSQPKEEAEFLESTKNYIEKDSTNLENFMTEIYEKMADNLGRVKKISTLEKAVDLIFYLEESKGNNQIRGHCATLMTRLNSLKIKYDRTLFSDDETKKTKFQKFQKNTEKSFEILDCSSFDDMDLLFFTSFILRKTLDDEKKNRTENMKHFIFDEAHRYISEEKNSLYNAAEIFEKISKEGRKFGVFMILASQRVSELSKTVLSQCNNFFLHRMRSNVDLEQIRKSVPFVTDSQIQRLSFLRTGHVLAVGEAFNIPLEIKVTGEKACHSSSTLKPSEVWLKKEMEE